ncbi:MAG: adenylyl-sulfate kinase [Deltaproteobacteria bacterium]|nr:adenylyl-sulfate kinase [Deltaproteobacteria bacterium]
METNTQKEQMNIVIAGHVDHGKSTVIGRLLADTGSLPEGKLEQVKENCRINSRPFEYAFLLDALKDEQAQGITIDTARVFFNTQKRDYIILDAPGHIEFLKNMVTGASRAEAALLVIDANEGVRENSRRHGYMISMLGIKQIAVVVNKMDLVDYSREVFEKIVTEYTAFLNEINVNPVCFIPVSGMKGDSIAELTGNIPWYSGDTVLEILDKLQKEPPQIDKPFRMPVQDVYKFTRFGDNRRIAVGTVETGSVKIGDEVVFYPSGKKSRLKSIETFNAPVKKEVSCGTATGLTLDEQIYITRGEIAVKTGDPKPAVSSRIKVNLFWLGKDPMVPKKEYLFKVGTAKVPVRLEEVTRVIDASDLNTQGSKSQVDRHDVAECVLKLGKAAAFDLATDIAGTSRFVIVDNYEIRGGGIIAEAMEDRQAWLRDTVMLRNYKWEKSIIAPEERAEKYNQKACLILLTGEKPVDKKTIAKGLEDRLFEDGKVVYFLGIGNVLYGIDADIKGKQDQREEHIRRLAEVVNIMVDAGLIVIVTATNLSQDDLEIIKTIISSEKIETVWVGDNIATDIAYDLRIHAHESTAEAVDKIKSRMQENGIIFKPW